MFSDRTPNGLFKSGDGRFIAWNDGTSGGRTVVRDKAAGTVTWHEDEEDATAAVTSTQK
jgi:hypothetical protein